MATQISIRSFIASMTVPSFYQLDVSNIEALQSVCGRLGLILPGLNLQTRCLRNCALMGPNAALEENTVRENIMTGRHAASPLGPG